MNQPERQLFIYDADCAFCTKSILIMGKWLKNRSPKFSPYQSLDLSIYGLSEAQTSTAAQYVDAQGRVWAGADAFSRALGAAGGIWGVLGLIMGIPGIAQASRYVYAKIAKNRHAMPGGTVACALPPISDDK